MAKKDKLSLNSVRYILPEGEPRSWDMEEELRAHEVCREVATAYLDTPITLVKRSYITALTSLGVLKKDVPWIAEHLASHDFYLEVEKQVGQELTDSRLEEIAKGRTTRTEAGVYGVLPPIEDVDPEVVLRRVFAEATDPYVPAQTRVTAQRLLADILGMKAPVKTDNTNRTDGATEPPTINLTLNATPEETATKS